MNAYTANLQAVLDSATESDWVSGAKWYSDANAIALELAYQHDTTLEVVASVISAFSPRKRWASNLLLAKSFLAGDDVKTFGKHIAKAERAKTDGLKVFNPKTGLKTWSFARNIMGDLDPITVDTHMVNASGHKLPPSGKLAIGGYRKIADAIATLAADYSVSNADMQAILWVAYRGSAH